MKARLALAAAFSLVAAATFAATGAPTAASAVADPSRPAADVEKDATRRPVEMIAFSKARAGDTVMDVWTGSGYWARLFSKIVGPQGCVLAEVPSEIPARFGDALGTAKAMAAEPGLGNVEVVNGPIDSLAPAKYVSKVDVVWIFEDYHDLHDSFMKEPDGRLADVAAYNRAVFKMLKPGGYYVVVDHAAPAGSGLSHTEDTHRIEPAALRAEVETAGFKFDGESRVLARTDDPHTALVFDKSIRGRTDRFAYRFRKPRS